MPIDYKKYPTNWKSVIRPAILERECHRCKFCGVLNYEVILRGNWNGVDCYQNEDGTIYDASDSTYIGEDIVGEVHPTNHFVKVILTIAHLNHDITDNRYENLAALCQRCHNRLDKDYRKSNRKRNKGVLELF